MITFETGSSEFLTGSFVERLPSLKEEILQTIYEVFADWSAGLSFACQKKCAVCCTQNVVMTALEGETIHHLIQQTGRELWFAAQLQKKRITGHPALTTNDFAGICLGQGQSVESAQSAHSGNMSSCPFLEAGCCQIYEARPFSCRCFASVQRCSAGGSAIAPEHYLSASTAVLQIIEHLGQGEYWGNMLDVLAALSDVSPNQPVAALLPATFAAQARVQLLKAKPLPGFLLLDEEQEQISPLLDRIFSRQIRGRTVMAILNGS